MFSFLCLFISNHELRWAKKKCSLTRGSIARIVRGICRRMAPDTKLSKHSITACHEAVDAFLVGLFIDIAKLAKHVKRETIRLEDMNFIINMRRF